MTLFAKLILFASSYSPLMLIWAMLLWQKHPELSVGIVLTAIGSLLFAAAAYLWARTQNTDLVSVGSVEARDGEAMSYMVSYLLPFLGVEERRAVDLIAVLVFFFILAVLYVNSNMVYTNPVANLFGFHLFALDSTSGKQIMVLSHRDYIPPGTPIKIHMVGDFVGLEAKK